MELFSQLRSALEVIEQPGGLRSPSAIARLTEAFRKYALHTPHDCYSEVHRIRRIAENLWTSMDACVRVMVFDLMKMVFENLTSSSLVGTKTRGPALATALAFFVNVVLTRPDEIEACNEACAFAAQCCRDESRYQRYAVLCFEIGDLAGKQIKKISATAVKNLLFISERRVFQEDAATAVSFLPDAIEFVRQVCEAHDSCGLAIRVCRLLTLILGNVGLTESKRPVPIPNRTIFKWIIDHMSPPSSPLSHKKCWKAVARFVTATLLWTDTATKEILVSFAVPPKLRIMILGTSLYEENTQEQLLRTVQAMCESDHPNLVKDLISNDIISHAVRLAALPPELCRIRAEASSAVDAFMRHATSDHLYQAVQFGIIRHLVFLLASTNHVAITDALRWTFLLCEEIFARNNAENLAQFKHIASSSELGEALDLLSRKPLENIRFAVAIIRKRLDSTLQPLDLQEATQWGRERSLILELFPPARHPVSTYVGRHE